MAAHYLDHVELAHLHPVLPELLEQPPHAVTHYAMDRKPIVAQPVDALGVVCHRFIPHEFVPQYLVSERVLDDHQAEAASPIGRVHVDHHFAVSGDDMYVAHLLQLVPDGLDADAVPGGNLSQRQLFIDILAYDRLTVRNPAFYKLPPAIMALV